MGKGLDRGQQGAGVPGCGGHDRLGPGSGASQPQAHAPRPEAAQRAQPPRDLLRRCLERDDAPRPDETAELPRISLEAEVPEALFEGMRHFLKARPDWDQYRVITSALAGFLFQNGCSDRCVAQHYLNGLFHRPGD